MDNNGQTALHWAARNGKDAVATQLLQAKANPNAANNDGNTPLHNAAYNGHAVVVDVLLQAKANPAAVNKDGETQRSTPSSAGTPSWLPACGKPRPGLPRSNWLPWGGARWAEPFYGGQRPELFEAS